MFIDNIEYPHVYYNLKNNTNTFTNFNSYFSIIFKLAKSHLFNLTEEGH